MKAIVVGSKPIENKGFLLCLTFEPQSASFEGSSVCTIFSKIYRQLGDTIDIACYRTSEGYKYYERTNLNGRT